MWQGDEWYVTLGDPGERGLCLAEIMVEYDSFSVWILGTRHDVAYDTMPGAKRAAIRELRKIHAAIGRHVVGDGK